MSGPDFARVLAGHVLRQYDDPTACTCGWNWDYRGVILPSSVDFDPSRYRLSDVVRPEQHRAHLSAALHAEVARWLGDEGTREVAGRGIHAKQEYTTCWDPADVGSPSRMGTPRRDLGEHGRDFYRGLATAALAALTTTEQEDDR